MWRSQTGICEMECAVASNSAFRFAKRAVTLDFLMVVKAPFVSAVARWLTLHLNPSN